MYVYDLPTTGNTSFNDFVITTDLISHVAQTTQLRARLRTLLKENRAGKSASYPQEENTDNVSDWLPILKAVEEYLPSLYAVFNSVQTDDLLLRHEPVFSWRTTLSSATLRAPPRIDLAGLYYELCSVLLLYALALSNVAAATSASLGSFERDPSLSHSERQGKNDKLKSAADTLCRAAGILFHLSTVMIPRWESHHASSPVIDGRPPELTRECTLALSKLCMAEAQSLAIRKLLSPSLALATDTITPGPPLPTNHPSPSLLAKIHINVADEFDAALALVRTVTSSRKTKSTSTTDQESAEPAAKKNVMGKFKRFTSKSTNAPSDEVQLFSSPSRPHDVDTPSKNASSSGGVDPSLDIASSFTKYLTLAGTLNRALAYKWLGVDAGESGNNVGQAITFLKMALGLLSASSTKDLSSALASISLSSSSTLNSGNSTANASKSISGANAGKSSLKLVREQEQRSVEHWLASYTKLNDTVSFQTCPSMADVRARVPGGRPALQLKEFTLPASPPFGPGSAGYVSPSGATHLDADGLHNLPPSHPIFETLAVARRDPSLSTAQYAGAGAYY